MAYVKGHRRGNKFVSGYYRGGGDGSGPDIGPILVLFLGAITIGWAYLCYRLWLHYPGWESARFVGATVLFPTALAVVIVALRELMRSSEDLTVSDELTVDFFVAFIAPFVFAGWRASDQPMAVRVGIGIFAGCFLALASLPAFGLLRGMMVYLVTKTSSWVLRALSVALSVGSVFVAARFAERPPVSVAPVAPSNVTVATTPQSTQVAPSDHSGPAGPPSGTVPVTRNTRLRVGQRLQILWNGRWYPGFATHAHSDGTVTVSYDGYDHSFDERVGRGSLRIGRTGD
jgi:hypothetical protein